jgi:TPR repeat protein
MSRHIYSDPLGSGESLPRPYKRPLASDASELFHDCRHKKFKISLSAVCPLSSKLAPFEVHNWLQGAKSHAYPAAAAWYLKLSADQGNPQGRSVFAACLTAGDGVAQNFVEAARYVKLLIRDMLRQGYN